MANDKTMEVKLQLQLDLPKGVRFLKATTYNLIQHTDADNVLIRISPYNKPAYQSVKDDGSVFV